MLKKVSLLLVLVMALGVVAVQCAAPATPAPAPAPTEAAPAATEAAAPAATEAAAPAAAGGVKELKILWAQWDPADYLQQIGNMYEQETGVKITVVQEPWTSFQDLFLTGMAAGSDAWDMVVGDSQWLGQGAAQGHYVDLTDFLVGEGIADTVTPATLGYFGEYPAGSGRYWGYPTEGDADGWAYRKDLFEDPAEMEAFKAKYGYDLAVPETYAQLKDIAEFFTRPDQGLYGVAIYTQKEYDAITMGVENTMFSWGAKWQDENNNVMGVVNSPQAIESVQFYKDLYDCCQAPGLSNAFYVETNDAFISGQSVMTMNYFAFLPALANPDINPYAEGTAYFSNPAGPNGDRHAALGGQGMSIISYISPERQAAAKDFIRWFAQEDIQAKWAELGGFTCNANVLQTDAFLNATPFNPAFAQTMTFVMDFWNIPVYAQLLEVTQREFSTFIVEGVGTAEDTMNTIAEEHDKILRDAGFIK
jgi:multiple sugar transport system substrate-binding protein